MHPDHNENAAGAISAESFLRIFGGLDVLLLVTDLQTDEILFANENMNRAYNVDYDPVGKHCYEVYQAGQTARCAFCALHTLQANPGTPVAWEAYNTATGRWFRNTSSVIQWTNGRLAHLEQGVDITEMKATADTLAHRLAQQQLMSTISQSFISTDSTDALIEGALRMVGEFLAVDRILLARIDGAAQKVAFRHAWFAPDVVQVPEDRLSQALSVGDIVDTFQTQARTHTASDDTAAGADAQHFAALHMAAYMAVPVWVGGTLWGMLSLEMSRAARAWHDSDIYLAQMVSSVISGVLHRDDMLREMQEAEARTQSMLDAMPLACTFYDDTCKVVDCNLEAVRMYGLADKQAYIDSFFTLSPEYQSDGSRSDEKALQMIEAAFESGREVFEWMHCRSDGTLLPTEITLNRVVWKGAHCVAGYARDLRELKAQMAQIERNQEDLRAARDRAQESAHAKATFLANMSHEIRTPMNAIIGMTDLAMKSDDLARIKYCLGKVDDASNHLLGIINDVLDISKIEAGKLSLSPTDFRMEKMLQRVTDIANFRAQQRHQDLLVRVDKNVPLRSLPTSSACPRC